MDLTTVFRSKSPGGSTHWVPFFYIGGFRTPSTKKFIQKTGLARDRIKQGLDHCFSIKKPRGIHPLGSFFPLIAGFSTKKTNKKTGLARDRINRDLITVFNQKWTWSLMHHTTILAYRLHTCCLLISTPAQYTAVLNLVVLYSSSMYPVY